MESLFEKFDQVTIDNSSKISITDREYCIKQYTEFAAAIQFCLDHITFLNNNALGDNEFLNTEDLIKKSEKYLAEITKSFITNIFYYFSSTYNVSINSLSAKEKYNHTVTWADLVDEIIEQLGGCNFTEKAVSEIKEKLKDAVDTWAKVQIKGHRLLLLNFLYYNTSHCGKDEIYMDSGSCENLHKLFRALVHYDCGQTEYRGHTMNQLTRFMHTWKKDLLIATHDFSYREKFMAVRLFKNGNVEIKFANSDLCEKFAREYCGFVKSAA